MAINISITPSVLERADEYRKARSINRSAFISYALEKVFNTEAADNRRDVLLEKAIKRWVQIPFNTPASSFYGVLYLLSVHYPNGSAKTFWTEVSYVGPRETTNKELFSEINRDLETLYAA